jgi:hypothetical protein
VQPALAPDGRVTALTFVPTPMAMPMRPPGKMAYQPTLPWWTAWHKDEQQAFNCWWVNQQFAHPVCGLGAAANLPTTPDFDNLRWVIRMGIPWNVDGALGQTPAKPSAWKTAGRMLGIIAASVAAAGAVTVLAPMVVGAAVMGGQPRTNPRKRSEPQFEARFKGKSNEGLRRKIRSQAAAFYADKMPGFSTVGDAIRYLKHSVALTGSGQHTLELVAQDYDRVTA